MENESHVYFEFDIEVGEEMKRVRVGLPVLDEFLGSSKVLSSSLADMDKEKVFDIVYEHLSSCTWRVQVLLLLSLAVI